MTIALCLRCGATKFGAFIPCAECGDEPVNMAAMAGQASEENILGRQDVNLSIAFSDHNFPRDTLVQFGQVIKSINGVCDDGEIAHYAFMKYIAAKHPEVLAIDYPPYMSAKAFQVLKQLDLAENVAGAQPE